MGSASRDTALEPGGILQPPKGLSEHVCWRHRSLPYAAAGRSSQHDCCQPHVYGIDATGQPDPDGTPSYRLIGVRQASTFTGFCCHHDTELFRPLETRPFITSKEQLFLLAYRAISKEVYAKRCPMRWFASRTSILKAVMPVRLGGSPFQANRGNACSAV